MGRIVSASDGLFWRLLLIGALSSLFVGLASSYFRIRFVHQFLQQLHWEVPAELDSVQLTEPPARDLLSLLFPQMQTLRLDASGRELGSGRPLIRSSDLHALLSKPLPELPIYSLPRDPTGASALTSVYPIPSLDGDKQLLCLVRNDVEPVSLLHALRSLPSVIAPVLLMLLGTTGVAVASSSRLLRGYNALRTIIEDLRHGNYSHTLGPAPSDELGRLEHQLIDLGASVSARENQIRTTRDERRTILGEIVHDARGPITACRGFMDSVLVTSTASNSLFLDQCFAGIRNSLRSYIALADRLRVAAAADEPARTGVLEIASVAEAVEETAARLLASARNRSIDLTVRSETSQALPIDRLLIERAVMNLLENALKFTPPGGKIDVATVADASHVTITVSDTGPGIPADLLPRIFDRYVHAGSAGQSGHGIGLATVKEIAAIHHGTVSVSSNSEDGTTFAISLPFTDFTQTQERVLETAPPLQPLRDLDGSRFVVAASLIVATTIAIVEKESAALALVGAPALILGTWYSTRRNSAARTTESAYQRVQTKLFATFILFWTLGISWAAEDPRSPWSLSYCAGTGMLSGFGSALIKRHPLAGWISLLPSFILITLRIVENDLVAFIFILSLAIGATVRIIAPREREMRLGLRSMVLLLVVIVISILLSGYSMNLMWRNSSSSLEVAGMQGIAARIAPLLEKSHTATNQLSLASSERLLSEVARLKKSFDLYLIDANGSVLFKSGWYSFP